MPAVHKLFQHVWKHVSSFNLRFPYSDSGGLFWRRLVARSSSSDASRSPRRSESIGDGNAAPQLKTLNMTRAHITWEENDMSQPPSPPVMMGQKGFQINVMDYDRSVKVGDLKSANLFSAAWQQYEDINTNSTRNETTRAQYELHPRRE